MPLQHRLAACESAAPISSAALSVADRGARNASLTLALVLPGDTVLYLLLPLYAAAFGVSLGEAGLLLAANRLVRIAGYGWVARGYERFGPRAACIAAACGAVGSTLGYALFAGLWPLLAARLLWGLSFAALNIATQALATAESYGAARRSGRSRAIISAGPMLGLLGSAVIADTIGPQTVFLVLGGIAVFGLAAAARVPAAQRQALRVHASRLKPPSPLDVWAFVQGLTLDGVFVVGLGVLASAASPHSATLAAGGALALRYAAEIALGPVGGMVAERCGAARSLIALSLASAVAYASISAGALWLGVVGVVLLRGLLAPLAAPVAAAANPGAGRVPAIAGMATWRDLGAGVGPIVAGLLLPLAPVALYAGTALSLVLATLALALVGIGGWRRGG